MYIKHKLILLLFSLYNKNDSINVKSVKQNISKHPKIFFSSLSAAVATVTYIYSKKNKNSDNNNDLSKISNNNNNNINNNKVNKILDKKILESNIKEISLLDNKNVKTNSVSLNEIVKSNRDISTENIKKPIENKAPINYDKQSEEIINKFNSIRNKFSTFISENKKNNSNYYYDLLNKLEKEEIQYIIKIYNYLNESIYNKNFKNIDSYKDEKTKFIIENLHKNHNLYLTDDLALYNLIMNKNFCKALEEDSEFFEGFSDIHFEEFARNMNEINNSKDLFNIKYEDDGNGVKNKGYLIYNLSLDTFFKNKDFIKYMDKNKFLKEYKVDVQTDNNNCFVLSLIKNISIFIYKQTENINLSKKEKENFISQLLYELEILSESMTEFFKKYHNKNYDNIPQDEIIADFKKMRENYFNNTKNLDSIKSNLTIKLLDNNEFEDDSLRKITETLMKFCQYYICFIRGACHKDMNFAKHISFIEVGFINNDLFILNKKLEILPKIFNYNGILSLYSVNIIDSKDLKFINKLFNPFFFETLLDNSIENNGHFLSTVFMLEEEYTKFNIFSQKLKGKMKDIEEYRDTYYDIIPNIFIKDNIDNKRAFICNLDFTYVEADEKIKKEAENERIREDLLKKYGY